MKVVEGNFGAKDKEDYIKPSDLFQALADQFSELEEEGDTEGTDVAVIAFKNGDYIQVLGNTGDVDKMYTLFSMAANTVMSSILGGE